MLIEEKKQKTTAAEEVHLGALAEIVVCLVVNIFQLVPGEETEAKRLNCGGKNVRKQSEQEMENISDSVCVLLRLTLTSH